jgi:hypothetical protein
LTKVETEYFAKNRRGSNERLACQARITKAGEVVIMTQKKKEKAAEGAPGEDANEKYRKEFSELPFEQKISNLVQLEAIALGETFSYVLNSPFIAFDKIMDVMADFGLKKEAGERSASRPAEHKANTGPKSQKSGDGEKPKPKAEA